jgi:hypothetical protein
LRRRLESDPWIRSALVKRVLPDKLVILVREKNPVGFVKDGDAVLLIDEEGAFIAPVSTPDAGIPEFRGIHVARLTRGDETERGRVRNGILFLRVFQQPNFLAGKQSLTAITLKSDDDIEAVIGGSLYLFRYPFPAQQWLRFLSVRSDILARHPAIEEIDLRYEGKVIVRPSREKA